jgi:hypothetical protein
VLCITRLRRSIPSSLPAFALRAQAESPVPPQNWNEAACGRRGDALALSQRFSTRANFAMVENMACTAVKGFPGMSTGSERANASDHSVLFQSCHVASRRLVRG